MSTQNHSIPQELLNPYTTMKQLSSVLYGVEELQKETILYHDKNRGVLDCIRRYNTSDEERTQQLVTAITVICKEIEQQDIIFQDNAYYETFRQAVLKLLKLTKTVSATDFILGHQGKAIVERGGELCDKKHQLSTLVNQITLTDNSIDLSTFPTDERPLIIALALYMLKGSDHCMEEVNRVPDAPFLIYYLAHSLAVLEKNLKKPYFLGEKHQLLNQIALYPQLQTEMQQTYRLKPIHIIQGTRREIFLPEEFLQPDRITLRRIADLLQVDRDSFFETDLTLKRKLFSDVIEKQGDFDKTIAVIMKLITNEFCDDFLVLSRRKKQPWQVGDSILGFICLSGTTWQVECGCTAIEPQIKIEGGDVTLIPTEANKAAYMQWRRKPSDLQNTFISDKPATTEKFLLERNTCIAVEEQIKLQGLSSSTLTEEQRKQLRVMVKRYQNRLWVYNQQLCANGRQIPMTKVSFIFSAFSDTDQSINNKAHFIAGVQNGIRLPFGNYGNIRFWREARRPECQMSLFDLSVACAFSSAISAIYQTHYDL